MVIVECPRDAMQGIFEFIPTETKIAYINQLLKVGFEVIDFGSFVSPKSIPQLRDTKNVVSKLDFDHSTTELLAIVGNLRGAQDACAYDEISQIGFPFSISETFQNRNLNSSISDSFNRLSSISEHCTKTNKKLVVYMSMAFGNPYGDPWSIDNVEHWLSVIYERIEVDVISLSDTIGIADGALIEDLFSRIIPSCPVQIGAHLHTTPQNWMEKIQAAYQSGCRRFDGAIKGYGGCPMATDKLTGNMPTEYLIDFAVMNEEKISLNLHEFGKSMKMAASVFP
jgi:hydroxymethylglutaryl-CoA lyase